MSLGGNTLRMPSSVNRERVISLQKESTASLQRESVAQTAVQILQTPQESATIGEAAVVAKYYSENIKRNIMEEFDRRDKARYSGGF